MNQPPKNPVRKTDLYVIPCDCGHQVETPAPRAICPKCGRRLEVQWEAEYKGSTAGPRGRIVTDSPSTGFLDCKEPKK